MPEKSDTSEYIKEWYKGKVSLRFQDLGTELFNSSGRFVKKSQIKVQTKSVSICKLKFFLVLYFDQWTGARTPFTGQNRLSDAKTTFSVTNGTK